MSFETLLVANRGEIARRILRSAHALGLRTVAVYTDADARAPFVREATEAVCLPGGSYLDGKAILEAARTSGAGAIHPGYGFLSENAGFAADVLARGLTWVGPGPAAIERMGDKLAAKALAEELGVPTLPSATDPAEAGRIGYPLLVKAAAGGGGKGMRVVSAPAELAEAVAAARREAQSGFGDERVFLERYVPRCRHVEIQILGDRHGNLVHLGERECSIQRRHQKILEECPSPRVDAALRRALGEAALALARALAYESAGTVEFLLDDASGRFYFLEVNTRLQVEHPVTEAVTGIDLVREQLRIAAGHPLGFAQDDLRFAGAAIEARLYAESPAADFLPATGTLHAFEPAAAPAVRWDSGVESGSVIGTRFDPMLAKVIAHAPTRAEAAARLALALERTHLAGVTTNRDFLVAALRTPAFGAGDTTTDFIERVDPPRQRVLGEDELARAGAAAALWLQGANRAEAPVLAAAPSGWRNARLPDPWVVLLHEGREHRVSYRALRDGSFRIAGDTPARVHGWSPTAIDVEIGGRRWRGRVTRAGQQLWIQTPHGDVELGIQPRFEPPGASGPSGGLVAPMPGKVAQLLVEVGRSVRAGETLLVLEAMKMEHPIRAPEDGVVRELRVALGEQVENGALLLVIEGAAAADEGST
ncbi:MAG: ATP-grasp domain-containing protein [Deltaproteobacteria bacterium]|nr:ATP-grasp domain-containing protein [Deltaproteobacteria bacterium]